MFLYFNAINKKKFSTKVQKYYYDIYLQKEKKIYILLLLND